MDAARWREELEGIVEGAVTFAGSHAPGDLRDESLHVRHREPFAVARPHSTDEVAALARWASDHEVPITPRGSGTGLSGGACPVDGGLVVCFDQMREVLSIDVDNHVAVVEAGVTLRELDEHLSGTGLRYPVYPSELSGSIGGNVATNAGGMRAVRHGVTRHHVLGLKVVLVDGTVLSTGGPVVKSSSGYDLTQLIVGSEGTLAMVTEATLKLAPVLEHHATLLVPFTELAEITAAVPRLIRAGLAPAILEYLDAATLTMLASDAHLILGVQETVVQRACAYLLVVLETRTDDQLADDLEATAALVGEAGALDVYVLEGTAATRLIEARERVFWMAKSAGADDIVDVVVPRASVERYLDEVQALAATYQAYVAGCGHVGDGNVHLSVFLGDKARRDELLKEMFRAGLAMGGAISGEHGLGLDKRGPYLALTDPALVEIQRRVKAAFDPRGLLNPRTGADG